MGNRGNQDYYKISGTPVEESDLVGRSRQKLARQAAEDRRREKRPSGPQATSVHPHTRPRFKKPVPAAAGSPAGQPRPSLAGSVRFGLSGGLRLARWLGGRATREVRGVVARGLEEVAERTRRLAERLRPEEPAPTSPARS